jgi:hypothetical protein
MRIPMSGLMRGMWMAAFLSSLLLIAPSVGAARAQSQSTNPGSHTTNPGSTPSIDGRDLNEPKDPMQAQMEARRVRSAASERQKKIMDDTAKLLQLATELKTDVDKTTKDEMSLDVIRKADEIERLAHDVKQRMKG